MIISNSEVSDYLKCQQLWLYKYVQRLTPKGNMSEPLAYGVYGHEWLFKFYKTRATGAGIEDSVIEANSVITGLINDGSVDNMFALHLMGLLYKYIEHYPDNNLKISGVEQKFKVPLAQDHSDPNKLLGNYSHIELGVTVDLIGTVTDGKYEGEEFIIDHKFTYNFWTPDAITLNSQLPKYIYAANANGHNVKRALINQLRYRQMSDNKQFFSRRPVVPSETRISNIINQHIKTSWQIVAAKRDYYAGIDPQPIKVLSRATCENCPFFSICDAELDGRNTDLIKKAHYTTDGNKYLDAYKGM
jgi:CRISPR/Cas system-associated exonuclease Cas4 (RecB family)